MKVVLEKELFLRTLDLSHWFILTRMVPDIRLSTQLQYIDCQFFKYYRGIKC